MQEVLSMTSVSETILTRYLVRKTKDQKTAFIDYLKSRFPELRVEEDRKNRNLILGDAASAKILLTAHYDTCAKMPFPNFITPMNFPVYLLYQLLIVVPFIALLFVVWGLVESWTQSRELGYLAGYFAMLGAMYFLLMGGPANPWTANDNTSGIITLLELYQTMTPEQKAQTAFVFFDNEESGLKGSKFFAKIHKKDNLQEKLLLNFDCVSDGDTFLFVVNKPAIKRYEDAFRHAFQETQRKKIQVVSSSKAFYPSDQANFPVNAAVSAMNRHKIVGLYMDKIHTPRDRVFDTDNIEFLRQGALRLLERVLP